MEKETILQKRREVIRRHGPWINHAIALEHGLYTEPCDVRARRAGWDDLVLRRIIQAVSDLSKGDFPSLRVLDLGALEGLYAVELARQGATVVATDVREEHLAKIQFVKDVLNLEQLEIRLDDVRNLSLQNYGQFDYTLCLGLLYHLDGEEACQVLQRIASVTTGALVLDTHIANWHDASFTFDGHNYYGRHFAEHGKFADEEQQKASLTASIKNKRSFWFTRKSLYRALLHAGFSSVQEVHVPVGRGEQYVDRITLVAHVGRKVVLQSSPENNALSMDRWAEEDASPPTPIVYLPNNYPAYGMAFEAAQKALGAARRARKLARRVADAVRARVRPKTDKGIRDDGFDKYRRLGAYHWKMLIDDPSYRARVSFLVDYLQPRFRCLDLGCGDGAYMEVLAPECRTIAGVDADATGVRLAKELLAAKGRQNAEVVCSRFELLQEQHPDWQSSFDVVYSMDTIEHLEQPEELLRACQRMVSQAGVVIIGTPEFVSKKEVSAYHVHEYSEEELRAIVGRFFRVEDVFRLPAPLPTTGKVQADRYLVIVARNESDVDKSAR